MVRENFISGYIDTAAPEKRGVLRSGAYDWRRDAIDCYHLALHLKALALGAKRFQTIPEMYHQESHGVIP